MLRRILAKACTSLLFCCSGVSVYVTRQKWSLGQLGAIWERWVADVFRICILKMSVSSKSVVRCAHHCFFVFLVFMYVRHGRSGALGCLVLFGGTRLLLFLESVFWKCVLVLNNVVRCAHHCFLLLWCLCMRDTAEVGLWAAGCYAGVLSCACSLESVFWTYVSF